MLKETSMLKNKETKETELQMNNRPFGIQFGPNSSDPFPLKATQMQRREEYVWQKSGNNASYGNSHNTTYN